MRLISLSLHNFRQFHGDQGPIVFASQQKKNVTLIFGANGSGKTALLNAFTWVLYKKTTPAFADPDHLISEQAVLSARRGAIIEARVRLEFEHEGSKYVALRSRKERKGASGLQTDTLEDGTLSLTIIDERGNSRTPDNADEVLTKVLPDRLYDFFFFDGERIERLQRDKAYSEIEAAIKSLLGLELLDRATRHLRGDVKKQLEADLRRHGTPELQRFIDDKKAHEEELVAAAEKLEVERENLRSIQTQIEDVKGKLRVLDETRILQKEVDALETQDAEHTRILLGLEDSIQQSASRYGYTAFLPPVLDGCSQILEDKRRRGEIPTGIKRQFVQDLLDNGKCICGAPLSSGSSHQKEVEGWLEKAGLSDVEESAMKVTAQFRGYSEQRTSLFDTLERLQTERAQTRAAREKVRERISDRRAKIGEKASEEIQDLNTRLSKAEHHRDTAQHKQGALENTIARAKLKIGALEGEIKSAQAKSEKGALVQRRLSVCREAADFLQSLYDLRTGEVRRELDERIRTTYQKISYKPYRPELTEEFRLVLRKGLSHKDEEVNLDVSQSTGENQILSLSFIGSIVAYARDRYERHLKDPSRDGLGFSGGIFPIVMDSPFGQLDENYRIPLAEGMPKLADQVVLLVSRSQGLGPVYDNIRSSVGRTYVVSYQTPKADADAEVIAIDGHEYPYISRVPEGERAILTEAGP